MKHADKWMKSTAVISTHFAQRTHNSVNPKTDKYLQEVKHISKLPYKS